MRPATPKPERTSNIPGEPADQIQSLVELVPGVLLQMSGAQAEAWVRVPLAGRAVTADPSFGVSLTAFVDVWSRPASPPASEEP